VFKNDQTKCSKYFKAMDPAKTVPPAAGAAKGSSKTKPLPTAPQAAARPPAKKQRSGTPDILVRGSSDDDDENGELEQLSSGRHNDTIVSRTDITSIRDAVTSLATELPLLKTNQSTMQDLRKEVEDLKRENDQMKEQKRKIKEAAKGLMHAAASQYAIYMEPTGTAGIITIRRMLREIVDMVDTVDVPMLYDEYNNMIKVLLQDKYNEKEHKIKQEKS
jgi:FtsZ-binding cell division protein ZapB